MNSEINKESDEFLSKFVEEETNKLTFNPINKLFSPCCGVAMIKTIPSIKASDTGEGAKFCSKCHSSWFLIKCVERKK